MRIGSLFTGIGGFDLSFERAGFDLGWAVELDAACRRVLAARFPRLQLHGDVREVHVAMSCGGQPPFDWCPNCLPAVDVLVGGWPCQPFSVAGRRRGTDDARDLWPEFARLVGELRPRWVVGENVPGLLSIDEGRVWARTIADLSDLGYGVCWRVLDAQHFGVPRRRRRVFLVASLGDLAGPATVLFELESGGGHSAPGRTAEEDVAGSLGAGSADSRRGYRNDLDTSGAVAIVTHPLTASMAKRHDPDTGTLIAAPLSAGSNPNSNAADRRREDDANLVAYAKARRAGENDPSPESWREAEVANTLDAESNGTRTAHAIATGLAVRRLTPVECERLQGFPDGWTDGQPDWTRYRQVGNAVAVPVAEWIANRLLALASALDEELPRREPGWWEGDPALHGIQTVTPNGDVL